MSDPITRPGSEEQWEALLAQLRHQPPAQPQPFFFARVQARLHAKQTTPLAWLPGWLRRPAYAALLGALILAVSGDGAAQPPTPAASHPVAPARALAR